MKTMGVLFLFSVFIISCAGDVPNDQISAELANAPMGGEYVGLGYLIDDGCNGHDPNNPADAEYFKPIPIISRWYPLNVKQTSFDFVIGTIILYDISPRTVMVNDHPRYEIDHLVIEQDITTYGSTALQGSIEKGAMKLNFSFGQYEGTPAIRGKTLCETSYDFYGAKQVNYIYSGR